ncbi:MAG: PIN domain-containing protein [Thermoanaerobaculia bacterium]|nr:PIN domain-containing protein [Thermoanaerobaculia bacterium]
MYLLDANVLLYLFDEASPHHAPCKHLLEGGLQKNEIWGVAWPVLTAFLRLSTDKRVFTDPMSIEEAAEAVESLLGHSQVVLLEPGKRFWALFRQLLEQAQVRGPLVSDAFLAALAIEKGALLVSADRDFSRFPGLKWMNPVS